MADQIDAPVLVTGATGKQGGAVARELLVRGVPVRALVRDPSSEKAETLRAFGVELVKGDLNEPTTLRSACAGVRAVFSVQMPDMSDLSSDLELAQARNLIEAAKAGDVPQFVQSSVSGTAEREAAPGWKEGRWHRTHMGHYWDTKAAVEALVRNAGFHDWTIVRPAFFMENFIRPSFLFANWTEDRLITAIKPDTEISMVAVRDIGVAVATAIEHPERFNRVELELAGDRLSMKAIAAVLSDTMNIDLKAPDLTVDEAVAAGMMPALVVGQEWSNEMPAPARPAFAHALDIPTTGFPQWAKETLAPQG